MLALGLIPVFGLFFLTTNFPCDENADSFALVNLLSLLEVCLETPTYAVEGRVMISPPLVDFDFWEHIDFFDLITFSLFRVPLLCENVLILFSFFGIALIIFRSEVILTKFSLFSLSIDALFVESWLFLLLIVL